jgi:ribosomal protein L22
MSPSKPENPQQGKPAEDAQIERDAAEAKEATAAVAAGQAAEPAPEPAAAVKSEEPATDPEPEPATTGEPSAVGTAAAETGVDKLAASAPAPAARATRARSRRPAAPAGVEVRAQAKYVRTSARKARLVCDHIRGKDVAEARAILAFTPRAAAKDWAKLLESAVANAEHNHELVGEDLRIAAVYADEGPTLKRFRPRAMGRATRIRKRTSHLTITLTPKER